MAKLTDFTAVVKSDYVGDTTIDCDQHVIDSVNHLSNIFSIPAIDTSLTTTVGQEYITKPSGVLKVKRVFVGGFEVKPLENMADLDFVTQNARLRWYEYGDKIYLTVTPTASSDVKLFIDKSFTVPTASVDTDLPERFFEAVYIGATYRYYHKIVALVMKNREQYPDIDPEEITAIRDSYFRQYSTLIKQLRTYAFPIQ